MKDRWLPHLQQFCACVDVIGAPGGQKCIAYTSASLQIVTSATTNR